MPREKLSHPSDHFFTTPKFIPNAKDQLGGRKCIADDSAQANKSDPAPGELTEESSQDTPSECPDDSDQGPIEKQLRKEYLEAALENDKLLKQLSTPPANIMDYGHITEIVKYNPRTNKSGVKSYSFNVKCEDGTVIKAVALEDMKVDCPAML